MIKCNRGVAREGQGFFTPDFFHIQPRNSSKTEKKVCARGGRGAAGEAELKKIFQTRRQFQNHY